VCWEPEPLQGDRETDQEAMACLEALSEWVQHLGLGSVEIAAQTLFESWESRSIEVLSRGLTKESWISNLSEDKTIFHKLKVAELHYIFDYLTKASSNESTRVLSKPTFLHAICFPRHLVGDQEQCPICRSAAEDDTRGAAGHKEESVAKAASSRGDSLSLHVQQVKCMNALLRDDSVKELALRVVCLGGQLGKFDSDPFDNSSVAGGFVAIAKSWRLEEKEKLSIKKLLETTTAEGQLLEIQLIRYSSPMPETLDPHQILASHSFTFADIATHDLRDLTVKFFSSSAIGRWQEGELLLEATVDVTGRSLLSHLEG